MNKMKKLLSVVLAIVLSLSCMSVAASAAVTSYRTVDDLNNLSAYSPYGQVTRLSTEERTSIVFDALDSMLPSLNINMGTVIDVLGLTITIDFTSINAALGSIDSFKSTFDNLLFAIVKGIVNLGILEELSFDTWASGMTREANSHSDAADSAIVYELAQLLANNQNVVETVLTSGIDLGIIAGMIGNLDLTGINETITDIPGMVKGMIVPMFERWDHTTSEITALENCITGSATISSTLAWVVEDMLTRDQSLTTVKADSTGALTSDHTLPTTGTRQTYTKSGTSYLVSHYYTQSDVDKNETDNITAVGYMQIDQYDLKPEYTNEDGTAVEGTDYVFQKKLYELVANSDGTFTQEWLTDDDGNQLYGENLKFYENDSEFLPSFAASGETFDITTESAAALLYKMIPYVFDELAPTVINGSLKKLLLQFFGATWTKLADNYAEYEGLTALPGYDASLEVFGEQGDYAWEWSAFDMITVDGVDYFYYRYQDQIFQADVSNCNEYKDIINWDFTIAGDFLNEFIPTGSTGTETSSKGYTRILHGVNDFLVKFASTVLDANFYATLGLTAGDNSNLVANVKAVAQKIIGYHPEHIFGVTTDSEGNESYGDFYNLIMSSDNDTVLVGIAALIIDALAPQVIIEPTAIYDASTGKATVTVGAILAAMLRELATQIVPSIDYDALIYTNYNTGAFVSGKDNSYWLDVLLTIGTDMGFKYLTAFSDMNEDVLTTGYFSTGGVVDWNLDRTYAEADLKLDSAVNLWEQRVDFIIDWACYVDASGTYSCWNMNNLIHEYITNAGYATDIATAEDPWVKLDAVLDGLLFLDQFTSETNLETGLRGTILDLVNLNWQNILGTESEAGILDIPASSKLRTSSLLNALELEIRDLINGFFKYVGNDGSDYYFIPTTITTLDALLTQANITAIVKALLGHLDDAVTNGLLTTVMPFVNFILGWKTDPQVIADPVVWTAFRDGNDYAYQWNPNTSAGTVAGEAMNSTYIYFLNNSAGMLETHRDTETTDHEYAIQIDSVTSTFTTNSLTFTYGDGNGYVSPYEQLAIEVGGTYNGDEAGTVYITYHYIGKDGAAVGGSQYTSIPMFISNLYEDANIGGRADGDDDKDYAGIDQFGKYQFTEDIYGTVTGYAPSIFSTSASTGSQYEKTFQSCWPEGATIDDCTGAYTEGTGDLPTGTAATYFGMYMEQNGGWPTTIAKDGSGSGNLYYALSGVTEDTEFPYGIYDMGAVGVKYKSSYALGSADTKVWDITYIYYNDYDVYDVYNTYRNNNYTVNVVDTTDTEAVAAYNRYEAALEEITRLATYPMMTTAAGSASSVDYVATIMDQIEPAIEEMKAAAEALDDFIAAAQATGSSAAALPAGAQLLEAELALDDGDGEKEINFQDYRFYEYFNYADLRTAARNLMKTYYAPEALDEYYIEGSGISQAELTNVIAAETNATVAAGITASRSQRTSEELAANAKAIADFQYPYNTYLYLADFASRLAYYRGFLEDVSANTVAMDNTFITREITYGETNFTDSSLYTEDSWTRYSDALAAAKAVVDSASDLPSDVFAAKYELMVAMKNLLLKSESAIENGATAELIALKAQADEILAMSIDDIELSEDAIAKGMTKEEALGHLIRAVGYNYKDEDNNEWNLYNDSALEYIDNDRPNKTTNIAKIDACETNLTAAIAYFAVEVALPELSAVAGTTGVVGETTTDETTGLITGYIYGVTAGTVAADYFALVDETTGTVEWAASTLSTAGTVDGTGATATVKDTDGNTVAVYTLVVFGDTTGDSAITAADYGAVQRASLGASLEAGAQTMAADINADDSVTAADYGTVQRATLGASITVNPYLVG